MSRGCFDICNIDIKTRWLNLREEFDESFGFDLLLNFQLAHCLIQSSPVVRFRSIVISVLHHIGVDAGIFRAGAVCVDVLN